MKVFSNSNKTNAKDRFNFLRFLAGLLSGIEAITFILFIILLGLFDLYVGEGFLLRSSDTYFPLTSNKPSIVYKNKKAPKPESRILHNVPLNTSQEFTTRTFLQYYWDFFKNTYKESIHFWSVVVLLIVVITSGLVYVIRYKPLKFHEMRHPPLIEPSPWEFNRSILRLIRRHYLVSIVIFITLMGAVATVGFLNVEKIVQSQGLVNHGLSNRFFAENGDTSNVKVEPGISATRATQQIAGRGLIIMGDVKWAVAIILVLSALFYGYASDKRAIVDWNYIPLYSRIWYLIKFTTTRLWMNIKILAKEHPFLILFTPTLDLASTGILIFLIMPGSKIPGKSWIGSSYVEILISLLLLKFSFMTSWIGPLLTSVASHVDLVVKESSEVVKRVIRTLDDHVIIGGYGKLGRFLAKEIFLRYYRYFKNPKIGFQKRYLRDMLMLPQWNFSPYVNQRNRLQILWTKGVVVDISSKFISEVTGEIGGNMFGTVSIPVDIGDIPTRTVYIPAIVQDINDLEVRSLLKFPEARLFVLNINNQDSIFSFLQWLTEEIKEKEVEAIIAVNRSMFFTVFPLWHLAKVFYVYPDLERGRMIARDATRLINWIRYSLKNQQKIRILLFEHGKQVHYILEGIYSAFYKEFDDILDITLVTTSQYKIRETTEETPFSIAHIPEKPHIWEHQVVRSIFRHPYRSKYLKEIKVYGVPYFNYRRIYELIRKIRPHLIIVSHNDAFENLNIIETVIQVARAWRHGEIYSEFDKENHFPVVLVGSGEGEQDSVKRLLIHLKWVIDEKSSSPDISIFNRVLTSETAIERFEGSKLLRAVSHLLVGVDEGLLNEIGAISDSLFSEDPSVELHVCFSKSEAPGAMLRLMAALAGYKVVNASLQVVPDFHVCGASRPSSLPEADVFYFEGNAKLIKLPTDEDGQPRLPGLPDNTHILTLVDSPKIGGVKKGSIKAVEKNMEKILGRIEGLKIKQEYHKGCPLGENECTHHVICPINQYSHFLLSNQSINREAIEETSRRGFLLFEMEGTYRNEHQHSSIKYSEAYISVCGSNSEHPGSMAVMLAKLLGVKLEIETSKHEPVMNVFFTKSQTCAGGREYKRIIGILSNDKPTKPNGHILNGLMIIAHREGAKEWENYLKRMLPVETFIELPGREEKGYKSTLTAFVYFSNHCRECPYYPPRSPRPQLCKIWHPHVKDEYFDQLPQAFKINF